MSESDDIRQPLDHLPKKEDRDRAIEIEEPSYPGTDSPHGGSAASPATAAEPDEPNRHGVSRLPPTGR